MIKLLMPLLLSVEEYSCIRDLIECVKISCIMNFLENFFNKRIILSFVYSNGTISYLLNAHLYSDAVCMTLTKV